MKKTKKENKKIIRIKKNWIDWKIASVLGIAIGLVIVYFNFVYFYADQELFSIFNMVAALIAVSIPLYIRYMEYSFVKKMEAMFPMFLRDITENLNAGMTLPQSIRTASQNEYGVLSQYAKEMSAKIDWGVSFEKALNDFAEKSGSTTIKRSVKTIIEAHRSGGAIDIVLEAVVSSVRELEMIKKERSTRIYSQMISGYFIFFLFLGVMIGMAKFLIPAFSTEGLGFGTGGSSEAGFYTQLFRNMIVLQGVFAGLGIGKMAEGTIIAGLKHAFSMSIIGYTAFVLFG
ncbi:MAG: type II secretion system F family protein [Candidatus Aenigmarchaeota archaeon]|nr:type II secretion system F family protein [Candidatus Aenigmarchaeota archaeon]